MEKIGDRFTVGLVGTGTDLMITRAQRQRPISQRAIPWSCHVGLPAVIAHDDVDVLLVLTSMNEHGALAIEALGAGKHVLVEKPMATSLEQAAELVELAGRADGLLV